MTTSKNPALVLVIAALLVLLTWPDAAALGNGQVLGECLDKCPHNVMTECKDVCDAAGPGTDKCWETCLPKLQAKCWKRCTNNEPAPRSIAAACP